MDLYVRCIADMEMKRIHAAVQSADVDHHVSLLCQFAETQKLIFNAQ